jgi:hypothetical protein
MRALSSEENGLVVRGSFNDSKLYWDFLRAGTAMRTAFNDAAPGGGSFLDVLKAWINLGCPLPAPKPAAASDGRRSLRAAAPAEGTARVRMPHTLHNPPPPGAHPALRVRGMGAIH